MKWTVTGCQNGVWGDEPDGVNDLACIRVADFDRTEFRVVASEPTLRAIEPRVARSRLLSPGDLLIEKSGGGEKQLVGAVVLFAHDLRAVCSNFVARMPVADGHDPRFLCYMHAAAYSARLNLRSIKQNTGIQNLDSEAYLNEQCSLPPLDEQRTIADFLDRKTSKIDALVAKKERLIELLQEKRTALITHGVTKGLDPNAPMKPSDSPFLPELPQHWVATRVRYLCRDVADGPHFSPKYVDDGVLFISARNVKVDGWSFDDAKHVTEADYREFSRRIVPERGDVLYTKGGTTGIARAVDFDRRFQVWVHIAVLKLVPNRVDPFFLAYALNGKACYEQSQLYTRGATNNDLGLTRLINISIAVPPLEEQRYLVQQLDHRTRHIDQLITRVRDGRIRLREYRTALISAAVTGKIDVREEVA